MCSDHDPNPYLKVTSGSVQFWSDWEKNKMF